MTELELKMEESKKSYDFFSLQGLLTEFYPQLTGNWDEDKDFWFEEHCEQYERIKNER